MHVASLLIEVRRADAPTSFKCLQMRASLEVNSQESFGEDAWLASQKNSNHILKTDHAKMTKPVALSGADHAQCSHVGSMCGSLHMSNRMDKWVRGSMLERAQKLTRHKAHLPMALLKSRKPSNRQFHVALQILRRWHKNLIRQWFIRDYDRHFDGDKSIENLHNCLVGHFKQTHHVNQGCRHSVVLKFFHLAQVLSQFAGQSSVKCFSCVYKLNTSTTFSKS